MKEPLNTPKSLAESIKYSVQRYTKYLLIIPFMEIIVTILALVFESILNLTEDQSNISLVLHSISEFIGDIVPLTVILVILSILVIGFVFTKFFPEKLDTDEQKDIKDAESIYSHTQKRLSPLLNSLGGLIFSLVWLIITCLVGSLFLNEGFKTANTINNIAAVLLLVLFIVFGLLFLIESVITILWPGEIFILITTKGILVKQKKVITIYKWKNFLGDITIKPIKQENTATLTLRFQDQRRRPNEVYLIAVKDYQNVVEKIIFTVNNEMPLKLSEAISYFNNEQSGIEDVQIGHVKSFSYLPNIVMIIFLIIGVLWTLTDLAIIIFLLPSNTVNSTGKIFISMFMLIHLPAGILIVYAVIESMFTQGWILLCKSYILWKRRNIYRIWLYKTIKVNSRLLKSKGNTLKLSGSRIAYRRRFGPEGLRFVLKESSETFVTYIKNRLLEYRQGRSYKKILD